MLLRSGRQDREISMRVNVRKTNKIIISIEMNDQLEDALRTLRSRIPNKQFRLIQLVTMTQIIEKPSRSKKYR